MKSYTDIGQSKKLAEILPIGSADMCWTNHCYGSIRSSMTVSSKTIAEYKNLLTQFKDLSDIDVFYPCWSLAALLDVIPESRVNRMVYSDKWEASSWYDSDFEPAYYVEGCDNAIDACYELILKLHKNNIL